MKIAFRLQPFVSARSGAVRAGGLRRDRSADRRHGRLSRHAAAWAGGVRGGGAGRKHDRRLRGRRGAGVADDRGPQRRVDHDTPAAAARSDGFRRNINQVRRERHALGAPHLRGRSPLRCQLDRQHAGPVRFGDALQRQRVQRLLVLDREGRERDAAVRNADRREHDRYRQQRHVYALRRLLRDPQAHPADAHLDPLVRPVQRPGAIRLRRPAGSARHGAGW